VAAVAADICKLTQSEIPN